ncbi:hypothetical protein GGS24DRAFT_502924 [Hypoxylon argillaceum]|nr:hypothetical protein GGS24DRAFT_502924 [Hypoxylon argillaceum]
MARDDSIQAGPQAWTFAEDATYLVVGGLSGIGQSMLKWMASRGAKNASAIKDALARFRFTQKKKTASIDLSVMRTTGVVAKSKALQRHLDIAENHLG